MYSHITIPVDVGEFHRRLYGGEIILFQDLPGMRALVHFTRELLERAFDQVAPQTVHSHLAPEQQAALFNKFGQQFTGSAEIKSLWRDLFANIGLDPGLLARDRLRIRFQPPVSREQPLPEDVMTSTVPFHRDTWGTNLYAQINWWAPLYPITEKRTMALYPTLWDQPLRNSSSSYDLQALVELAAQKGRAAVTGAMAVPELLEAVDPAGGVPVVIEPGSIIAFSSAHAHAGVLNTTELTRISLETRTVSIPDFKSGAGAPNVDGAAKWMAPGFFFRLSDGRALNEILAMQRLEPAPIDSRTS